MGTALQIPRLTTPPSTTTIRQSLNLLPSSAITPASASINRSSSVKVTKYDYRNNDLEDEFDDTVQIRRAVSVKKNGLSRSASVGAHPQQQQQAGRLLVAKPTMVRIVTRTEGGVTRKASVKSADPAPPRTTTTTLTNDSNSHLVATDSTSSASSADHDDGEEDGDDVLLRVEDPPRPRTSSWISQQSGEITVIWDRHDNNNAESSGDVK